MASPCASAPSSSRYAIARAVTAGCRRVNTSASRCARSSDHDAIAFQVSTSVGRSVMTAHALVAARRITRQRRRAEREDVPPAVARRRLAEDVHVFVTLDAFVRRARPGGELVDEREAGRARLAQLDDPGVRLTGVRERLPLPERDVEEHRGSCLHAREARGGRPRRGPADGDDGGCVFRLLDVLEFTVESRLSPWLGHPPRVLAGSILPQVGSSGKGSAASFTSILTGDALPVPLTK